MDIQHTTKGENKMTAYRACHGCAIAIEYNDLSAMDEATAYRVTTWMETVGLVFPHAETDAAGFWICDACGYPQEDEHAHIYLS